ncbi:uncharacterized protein LOC133901443 [Phragmites australis]|uniref:uncharacterized protein LOC133901443 n=1 Tax=Phragmites australis TaxID=29695 RepID=UPI002D79D329|nr:uncharacterized protein LOC133901443 [Phragmites australis]
MVATLAAKCSMKEAWEAIKTMKMGMERMRKAKAQVLRREFEAAHFKDGENIEDFSMCLGRMINMLSILGDTINEEQEHNCKRDQNTGFNNFHRRERGHGQDTRSHDSGNNDGKDTHNNRREANQDKCRSLVEEEEPALLMVVATDTKCVGAHVLLNEEHAYSRLCRQGGALDSLWYLDIEASNHMTRNKEAFTDLNTGITRSVKFGDGSTIDICGQGFVRLTGHGGRQRFLMAVYYIPWLHSNLISLDQLDEVGCQVMFEDRTLRIKDREQHLLAKVVSVAYIKGGEAFNVIPESVIQRQAAVSRCATTIDFMEEKLPPYPATVNDEAMYAHAKAVAEGMLGEANVRLCPQLMTAG